MRTAAVAAALAVTLAPLSRPQPSRAAVRLLLDASRALQAGDGALFLSYFDRKRTAEFSKLRDNVLALLAQKDVASSIDVVSTKQEGDQVRLEVDWLLELTPRRQVGPARKRRETVTALVAVGKKKPKIVSIDKIELFRP